MVNVLFRAALGGASSPRRSSRPAPTTSIPACTERTGSSAAAAMIRRHLVPRARRPFRTLHPRESAGWRSPQERITFLRSPAIRTTAIRITRISATPGDRGRPDSAPWRRTCSKTSTSIARSFRRARSERRALPDFRRSVRAARREREKFALEIDAGAKVDRRHARRLGGAHVGDRIVDEQQFARRASDARKRISKMRCRAWRRRHGPRRRRRRIRRGTRIAPARSRILVRRVAGRVNRPAGRLQPPQERDILLDRPPEGLDPPPFKSLDSSTNSGKALRAPRPPPRNPETTSVCATKSMLRQSARKRSIRASLLNTLRKRLRRSRRTSTLPMSKTTIREGLLAVNWQGVLGAIGDQRQSRDLIWLPVDARSADTTRTRSADVIGSGVGSVAGARLVMVVARTATPLRRPTARLRRPVSLLTGKNRENGPPPTRFWHIKICYHNGLDGNVRASLLQRNRERNRERIARNREGIARNSERSGGRASTIGKATPAPATRSGSSREMRITHGLFRQPAAGDAQPCKPPARGAKQPPA